MFIWAEKNGRSFVESTIFGTFKFWELVFYASQIGKLLEKTFSIGFFFLLFIMKFPIYLFTINSTKSQSNHSIMGFFSINQYLVFYNIKYVTLVDDMQNLW